MAEISRKKMTIYLDENVCKQMKKHCIDVDKNVSEYIQDLISKDLGKVK